MWVKLAVVPLALLMGFAALAAMAGVDWIVPGIKMATTLVYVIAVSVVAMGGSAMIWEDHNDDDGGWVTSFLVFFILLFFIVLPGMVVLELWGVLPLPDDID